MGFVVTVYEGRCGKCKKFPENGTRCKHDTQGRKAVYANDYECGSVDK